MITKLHNVHYISIEGLDAVGKDTHTAALSDSLRALGYNVYITHHGYDTQYGNDIIETIKNGNLSGDSELSLMFALWYLNVVRIHRDIQAGDNIYPSLRNRCYGTVVIFNRYIDSTYVYQVNMNGGSEALFNKFHKEILGGLTMDFTAVLTALPATVIKRNAARKSTKAVDNKEFMSLSNHEKMQQMYHDRLMLHKHAFISTEKSIDEVQSELIDKVVAALNINA